MPFGLFSIFTSPRKGREKSSKIRLLKHQSPHTHVKHLSARKKDELKTLLKVLKMYFREILNVIASNHSIDDRPKLVLSGKVSFTTTPRTSKNLTP